MYLGRIVEIGDGRRDLCKTPQHPYTQALLDSVPKLVLTDGEIVEFKPIAGELPSPLVPPPGCAFHPRCPHAIERCRIEVRRCATSCRRRAACHPRRLADDCEAIACSPDDNHIGCIGCSCASMLRNSAAKGRTARACLCAFNCGHCLPGFGNDCCTLCSYPTARCTLTQQAVQCLPKGPAPNQRHSPATATPSLITSTSIAPTRSA